ncbi:beta strand repeat-containing protein [Paraburkholderia phenazinium]|uniref:Uncharacterized protein n=1 Tax=Paraburkholderia phenazinium TaxID=60549 RepID=A0A1N6KYC1_9BURK|nr:S-layer family protein [Paraburkholderia phenazinium]SIO61495.1 hypothetical protein SAMN05444165_5252 [Paraburkholderia phenazinium]
MSQDNLNNTITPAAAIWGGNPPSAGVLAEINNSQILVQSINQYDNAIQAGTAASIGVYLSSDPTVAYSNGKETITNSAGQVQILLGGAITDPDKTDAAGYVSALTWEMGKFVYFSQGQQLYNAVANLNPNDPNYGNAAAVVGTLTEAWSAAFSYQVQQQIASTSGATFTIDGDGPNNANGAIQQTLTNAWQGQNLANASSTDAFAALTTAALGVIGTFPAVNGESYPDEYQQNPAALQQEYSNASLNGVKTYTPSDISGIEINDSNGNLSSSTLSFSSGGGETLNFTNNQVSSAIYVDSLGNNVENIAYVHNADGSYSSTITDGTGAVVSTESFSSSGAETQTFADPSSTSDVNASGVTLTTNASTIDVNGADYDTTILNGDHVINAQAGDNFQLTGVGYDVNLSATGAASTVTFEANSGGTVNGAGNAVNLAGTSDNITTSGNTVNIGQGNQATINGSSNSVSVGQNDTTTLSGGGNIISADGNASGSTFTLEGTGTNVDTLNLDGATDVSVLLGDATTEAGFVSTSATVSSLNGGGIVTGSVGDNLNILGVNVTLNASGGQYSLTGTGEVANTTGAQFDLGANTQVSIAGSDNTTILTGTGNSVSVTGDNNVTTTALSGNALTYSGTDNQFQGSGSSVTLAENSISDVVGDANTVFALNNSSGTINGGGNTISGSGSISGNTFTLEGTGTNADTVNLAGATDVSVLLGDTTTDVGFVSTSATVSSLNGGGIVTGSSGDNLNILGVNVTLNANGGQYSLAGTGDSASVSNSTVSIASGNQATLSGSDNTVTASTSDSITLDGIGDTVTAGTGSTIDVSGQSDSVTASGSTIDLAADSQATISGTGDNVAAASGDVIDLSNATITLTADSSVTIEGSNDTVVGAASDNITIDGGSDSVSADSGSSITIAGLSNTIDASQTTVALDGNTSVNINGSADAISETTGDSAGVYGAGNSINTTAGALVYISGTNGDADTVSGNGDQFGGTAANGQGTGILLAANSQANITGSDDGISETTGDSMGVKGGGNSIDTGAGALTYITGTNGDADAVSGNGDQFGGTTANGQDTGIVLTADSQANITGSDDGISETTGDSMGVAGGGNSIDTVAGALTYITDTNGNYDDVTASNDAMGGTTANGQQTGIVMTSDSQANIFGNGDGISESAGDSAGIYGGGNSIDSTAGALVYISGTDGSDDTVHASDDAMGGATANGQQTGIVMTSDSQANIFGNGDGISESTGDSAGIYGGGNSIDSTAGALVYISGTDGSDDTVTASNDAMGGTTANGQPTGIIMTSDSQANIFGNSDGISESAGDSAGIYGGGNSIDSTAGALVYISGTDGDADKITANDDDSGGTTANGQPTGIVMTGDSQADIYGNDDTTSGGDDTSVMADGSGDTLNGQTIADDSTADLSSSGSFSDTDDGSGNTGDPSGGDGDPDPDPDDGIDDPVILNLTGGQVQTTSVTGSTTYFDMQNDGQSVQTAWMTPGEGMLVYDPANPNSATDDADLVSGFAALDALDSNGDGVLNASDSAWSQLRVLVDVGNGQPDQLFTLGQLGISSINLNATAEEVSQNGNIILANSTFTRTDGSTGDVAGVALQFNPGSIQSTAAGGNASVTSQAFVDHRLNQLIAGMASFNPQSAGSTNLMHDEHGQHHMVLAASSH